MEGNNFHLLGNSIYLPLPQKLTTTSVTDKKSHLLKYRQKKPNFGEESHFDGSCPWILILSVTSPLVLYSCTRNCVTSLCLHVSVNLLLSPSNPRNFGQNPTNRAFQKHTKLAMLASLPTFYSHIFAVFFCICTT